MELDEIRHREWRKIAKRERRRRIRMAHARSKDCSRLLEQEAQELFEHEQIEKQNMEEHEKWVKAERIAMDKWHRLQEESRRLLQKRKEQEEKIILEWELEKERKRIEEQRLKQIEEENKKKQEVFIRNLEEFLTGDSNAPPSELTVFCETKPNNEPCPFFSKTACCRFGDQCSRNHTYPGISKVLLATNFYSHFGLDNTTYNEYDTDVMLEYEDSDTYKEFKEFFYDVVPEFEKFGRIVQFKVSPSMELKPELKPVITIQWRACRTDQNSINYLVMVVTNRASRADTAKTGVELKVCNNHEKHLRGNTYVEYSELRCAVAAYRALHSRWYGGKQLTLQFCTISSWKNAICGLQSRKRCPKGRSCNFLHVFKNPNNLYSSVYSTTDSNNRSHRTPPSTRRCWRWSESPEVEVPSRQERPRSRPRNRHVREDRREDSKHPKLRKRYNLKRNRSSERCSRKIKCNSDSD